MKAVVIDRQDDRPPIRGPPALSTPPREAWEERSVVGPRGASLLSAAAWGPPRAPWPPLRWRALTRPLGDEGRTLKPS